MGDNKLLKVGMVAVATAATTIGSIILADKSLKKLVKGVVELEPSKIRKPVQDNEIPNFDKESVVREPSLEPAEEILPNLEYNDIAKVINNANAKVDQPQIQSEQSIVEPPIGPLEEAIPAQPIIANDEVKVTGNNPFATDDLSQVPTIDELPEIPAPIELPQQEIEEPEKKPEVEITMGLPYIAGKLEDLELNESPNPKAKNAVKTEEPKAMPVVDEKVEVTTLQEEISNPFLDTTLIDKDINQPEVQMDESVLITSPVTDEPIVALPIDEDESVVGDSPVIVSGPFINQSQNLPEQPDLAQSQESIEFEDNTTSVENEERKIGEPIIPNHMEYGKTKVIGSNIVSDEPYNKAIEMVAKEYQGVQRDRLVSIMSQDGAGIVFEFSNSRAKNEDTLVNVYSIKPNGDIVLPSTREKAGAIEFGKTFITDKPELSEFFTR